MKRITMLLSLLLALGGPLLWMQPVQAQLTLPSYAAGADVKAKVESTGKKVTDIVALIVGVLGIIGLLVGFGHMGLGKGDEGKRYVISSLWGLGGASVVYGLAQLFT